MKKAVIFDMDGLMIDSEQITYEEYCLMLASLGYDFDISIYRKFLGKNKPSIYQVYQDVFGDAFPKDKVWDEVHVCINNRLEKEVPLKKGLLSLLAYLKEHNYKTIVATSSAKVRAEAILKKANIDGYFDTIICGDEVTHGKPDPEIFITACHKLNVTREEALVLEDSEAGIEAAYKGNIDVICVPDMKYPEAPYDSMPIKIMFSLEEVIPFLENQ
jgi:HAD superfamily hydrolase (TIGR01509 family)